MSKKVRILCVQSVLSFFSNWVYRNVQNFLDILTLISFYSGLNILYVQEAVSNIILHRYTSMDIQYVQDSDPFYTVSYYIKWVTTSWTHSTSLTYSTDCPRAIRNLRMKRSRFFFMKLSVFIQQLQIYVLACLVCTW